MMINIIINTNNNGVAFLYVKIAARRLTQANANFEPMFRGDCQK